MAKSDQYFPYCKFCICGLVTYSGLVSYPGCITTSHQHSRNRPWTLITNKLIINELMFALHFLISATCDTKKLKKFCKRRTEPETTLVASMHCNYNNRSGSMWIYEKVKANKSDFLIAPEGSLYVLPQCFSTEF